MSHAWKPLRPAYPVPEPSDQEITPDIIFNLMIPVPGREELYQRHQLSHQQIDDLLGESRSAEFPESKAQHLPFLKAFRVVSEMLESGGIEFMPQKGPILSFRLYGDPLYRAYNDLDFYIPTDRVAAAVDLLMQNGFRSPYYRFPGSGCRQRLLFRHTNELFLQSEALETGVELHWSMFNARLTSTEEHDRLVEENRRELFFEGRRYHVLQEEAELLFLVIHGGLHAWSKLKWLVDIAVFLERCPVDGDKFLELTRRLRATRLVSLCNRMLACRLPGSRQLPSEGSVPASMVSFAVRQSVRADHKKSTGESLAALMFVMRAFPGAAYRTDLIRRNLYATDLADAGWIPCFAPAYYAVGPAWKLYRGFR